MAVAALVVGPTLSVLTSLARDADGGGAATLLVSGAPIMGAIAGLVAIAIASGLGMIVARITNPAMGLFCAGAAIAWPAFTGAVGEDVIRVAQSASPLWVLAGEGLLVTIVGVAASWIVIGGPGAGEDSKEIFDSQNALAASVTFLVGAIVAWALAREGTPGQILAAAGIASIVGIAAGQSVAPGASMVVCIGAALLLSVLGPAAGAILQGRDIVETAYSNGLFPLARITPLFWLAGAWMGAPIGAAWAASMLEKRTEATSSAKRA